MKTLCQLIASSFFAAGVLAAAAAEPVQVAGRPVVVDGDTLKIGGEVVRLVGVDACEVRQRASLQGQDWPCGQVATAWLALLTLGQELRCQGSRRDRGGRLLARCTLGGEDIGRRGLAEGIYVAYRYRGQLTVPEYGPVEEAARAAGVGLWASRFDMPWDWRRNRAR